MFIADLRFIWQPVSTTLAIKLSEMDTRLSQLSYSVPGLVPLSIANIVSASPGGGGPFREADNLFDRPGDPYLIGGTGEYIYTVLLSTVPNGVVEVVLDLIEAVQLIDFSFYSNSGLQYLPRDYEIFSGDSGTGPWTLRATKNLTGATPVGNTIVSVPVDFTARYCRLTFKNMHSDNSYLQLSECRVTGMLGCSTGCRVSQGQSPQSLCRYLCRYCAGTALVLF
jgi:hypothetical protein